jgi:hypothetical protein
MMSPRLRSAQVILAWQVVLVLFALGLCYASTERSQIYVFGSTPYAYQTNAWTGYFYRGHPVPWAEYNETRHSLGDPFPVAHNLAVPACLLMLGISLPLLVAAERERRRSRATAAPKGPRTRRVRGLWVVVLAAGSGWTVALIDAATDPVSNAVRGVGHVPFHWVPGGLFLVYTSPPPTPPVDHPVIEQVRKERGELFPPDPGSGYDPLTITHEWDARTRRTLVGIALGLVCGCILVRPWHRSTLSGKLDVDGTSCPLC